MEIEIKILNSKIANYLPKYATDSSAGLDCRACIDTPYVLKANESKLIPTGFAIYIKNPGYAGLILPRSGLGHKHGIVLGNLVGLIDADYQGELNISVWNRSDQNYTIEPLDRLAQLVIVPIMQAQFKVIDEFKKSERGMDGFGSTGLK